MRILVTHPTSFERVRRGTERLAEETAAFLGSCGHDVTFLACRPGAEKVERRPGFRLIERKSLWRPWMRRCGVHEFMTFGLQAGAELAREHYDLAYCYSFVDAAAARVVTGTRKTPVVMVVNGLPLGRGGPLFRYAARAASEVVVFSEFVNQFVLAWRGRRGVVIPAPVDLNQFPFQPARDLRSPRILCTAALDDPRKGGRLTMRAFNLLKQRVPGATLQVASRADADLQSNLLSMIDEPHRKDVMFTGDGRREDLARLYAEAAVTVLASVNEAFGMVVTESMATGTPVAAVRHGALPEIITDGVTGCLADPGPIVESAATNAEALSAAMYGALELARKPETARLCRQTAERFSWTAAGPLMDQLCRRLIGAG